MIVVSKAGKNQSAFHINEKKQKHQNDKDEMRFYLNLPCCKRQSRLLKTPARMVSMGFEIMPSRLQVTYPWFSAV